MCKGFNGVVKECKECRGCRGVGGHSEQCEQCEQCEQWKCELKVEGYMVNVEACLRSFVYSKMVLTVSVSVSVYSQYQCQCLYSSIITD